MTLAATAFLIGYLEKSAEPLVKPELVSGIGAVESSHRPGVISKVGKDFGEYQHTQISVDDYNRRNGTRFSLKDMLDEPTGKKVMEDNLQAWSQGFRKRHGRVPNDLELATMHHRGPRGNEKGGVETGRYRIKVDKAMKAEGHVPGGYPKQVIPGAAR